MYKSQIKQDAWVLKNLNNLRGGYFVDIGAHDGISMSNTHVLEKEFGWSGICVEPNPDSFKELSTNRTCDALNMAVSPYEGVVYFDKTDDPTMGHICNYKTDIVVQSNNIEYILSRCPKEIDYISLDIEGLELSVLESFPWGKYKVKCWTIEHNIYTNGDNENYSKILQILMGHNYLVKTHDWDFFAVLDDIKPEFYYNYEGIVR